MSVNDFLAQAVSLHQRGDFRQAKESYLSVIELDSANASAWYGLATLSMQNKCYDEAKKLFLKALEFEPEAPDIHYNYAVCLFHANEKDACRDVLMQAHAFSGGDMGFLSSIADLLLKLKCPDAVIKVLDGVESDNKHLQLLRARAYGLLEEWATSAALLSKLYEQSKDPKLARELSNAAGRSRNYSLAIWAYSCYMSSIEPSARDYLSFADLYFMAQDIDACKLQLERAFALGDCGVEALVLKGRVERLAGNYSSAEEAAEQALSKDSLHGQAWSLRVELAKPAHVRSFIGELEKSAQLSVRSSVFHRILIHYSLADAYEKLDNYGLAIEARHKANSLQRHSLDVNQCRYDHAESEQHFRGIIQGFPQVYTHESISSKARPIFIVGMPRSGTTLVERILGQIDSVEMLGENEALSFVVSQYYRDAGLGRMPAPCELTAAHWQNFASRYFERTASTGLVVTDKLPHNVQNVGFILSAFPDAKVIQMRRNPVDVCLSIYERYFPDSHNYACSFDDLSHFYLQTSLLMDHWGAMAPGRVLDVHYESLVSNAEAVARSLVQFCDLPWQDECLQFHKKIASSFTFSEMQVREPINAGRVARWRKYESHIQPLINSLSANFDVGVSGD